MRATMTVPGATPAPVSAMPGTKAEPRCRKAAEPAVETAVSVVPKIAPAALFTG